MKARYKLEIERLYLQLYPLLFEYARSSLSSDSLAEEAVQDTFRIACQKPEAMINSPNPEGWIMNTLKNVLKNTIRNQNISRRILLDYFASNINDITVTNDRVGLEILYEDVADLEEFKMVKAMALEGKSYLEMSQELGVSMAACRKRMQRARETLRKKIKL